MFPNPVPGGSPSFLLRCSCSLSGRRWKAQRGQAPGRAPPLPTSPPGKLLGSRRSRRRHLRASVPSPRFPSADFRVCRPPFCPRGCAGSHRSRCAAFGPYAVFPVRSALRRPQCFALGHPGWGAQVEAGVQRLGEVTCAPWVSPTPSCLGDLRRRHMPQAFSFLYAGPPDLGFPRPVPRHSTACYKIHNM